jgi:D-2-hydroxyglutarate dehydrogenase
MPASVARPSSCHPPVHLALLCHPPVHLPPSCAPATLLCTWPCSALPCLCTWPCSALRPSAALPLAPPPATTLLLCTWPPHLAPTCCPAACAAGIITSVAIQCAPRPASVQLAFLACASFQHVQQVLLLARRRLGEILSAVEFLDSESMSMVTGHLPDCKNPLGSAAEAAAGGPFYMLVETHGSNEAHDAQKLEAFLEEASGSGAVQDGLLAQSGAQAAAVWRVREGITESLVRRGAVYKYDVSMPVADMYQLVEDMRGRLAGFDGVRVVGYGHVGDGNLHLNVSAPEYSDAVEAAIEPFVYEWVTGRRGSISAEHGLGRMKAECVGYSKPAEAVQLMGSIKRMLDPHGILNPYKVLPSKVAAGVYGAR